MSDRASNTPSSPQDPRRAETVARRTLRRGSPAGTRRTGQGARGLRRRRVPRATSRTRPAEARRPRQLVLHRRVLQVARTRLLAERAVLVRRARLAVEREHLRARGERRGAGDCRCRLDSLPARSKVNRLGPAPTPNPSPPPHALFVIILRSRGREADAAAATLPRRRDGRRRRLRAHRRGGDGDKRRLVRPEPSDPPALDPRTMKAEVTFSRQSAFAPGAQAATASAVAKRTERIGRSPRDEPGEKVRRGGGARRRRDESE